MCEDEVPGWALKSKSTNYPDHGHHGDLPLPGKLPMVEPGIGQQESIMSCEFGQDRGDEECTKKLRKLTGKQYCVLSCCTTAKYCTCVDIECF